MTIVLTNISASSIVINDLGMYLNPGEDLDLLVNYTDEVILDSINLESIMDLGDVEVKVNNNIVDYKRLRVIIKKLSQLTHEVLATLVHVTSDPSFTLIFRDILNRVEHLEYFTDGSMSIKTREDVLVRLPNGKVDYILMTQFDEDEEIRLVAKQVVSRDINGLAESIEILDVT